jgi:hypothetical protein
MDIFRNPVVIILCMLTSSREVFRGFPTECPRGYRPATEDGRRATLQYRGQRPILINF